MSERRVHRAFLSLGSNIEPERNLREAVGQLAAFGDVIRVSNVWESPPFQPPVSLARRASDNFLNAAVLFETDSAPLAIYDRVIRAIERVLKRVRDPEDKYASRTIDVDLSLYDYDVIEFAGHRIPDPDILKRDFVAVPLAELDPDYVHPVVGKTLAAIAADLAPHTNLSCRADVSLKATSQP